MAIFYFILTTRATTDSLVATRACLTTPFSRRNSGWPGSLRTPRGTLRNYQNHLNVGILFFCSVCLYSSYSLSSPSFSLPLLQIAENRVWGRTAGSPPPSPMRSAASSWSKTYFRLQPSIPSSTRVELVCVFALYIADCPIVRCVHACCTQRPWAMGLFVGVRCDPSRTALTFEWEKCYWE